MEPLEVEFFAEKEEVTIIPNFSENKICLISVSCKKPYQSGDFGPFNPSMHTKVPLWLAINLKQRHKCRIEPPAWLSVEELTEKMTAEKASTPFTKMASPHYMEVASLLLNNAAEDIPRADEVRALVQDLWDLRIAKLRKSVDQMITEQETYGKLDNLTKMEINTVRQLLTESLNHTHLLRLHAGHHATVPIPDQF